MRTRAPSLCSAREARATRSRPGAGAGRPGCEGRRSRWKSISVMAMRHAVTRGGTELVYWTWPGAGPPALLLYRIGNYGRYLDLFADAVGDRLTLVAPDARGHGESGRPADGYTPADFTADALAVLHAAGIARAGVVGHPMGGLHSINPPSPASRTPSRA